MRRAKHHAVFAEVFTRAKNRGITGTNVGEVLARLGAKRKAAFNVFFSQFKGNGADAAIVRSQALVSVKEQYDPVMRRLDKVRTHIRKLRGQGVKGRARLRVLIKTNPDYKALAK